MPSIGISSGYGGLFCVLTVSKISTAILVFYIFFYLPIWGDNLLILYGSALLIIGSVGIYCCQNGFVLFANVPYAIWNHLILLGYILTAGFFAAFDYGVVVKSSVMFTAYSFICVSICYVSTEEDSFDWIFYILIALAILCAFYTMFRGAVIEGYGKSLSANCNPHTLAASMNLGIFAVAYLSRKMDMRSTLIAGALIALFMYTIINCGSRKVLFSSAMVVCIWLWASFRERWTSGDKNQRAVAVLLILLVLVGGFIAYRRFFTNSLMFSRMNNKDDMGDENRLLFYRKAVEIFMDRPILGGGYDQFQFWSRTGYYSHSTYAEAIADLGALGCAIYFFPLLYTVYVIVANALFIRKDYHSILLLAFCGAELFLGVGQIFFMEFSHFIAWTILYYNSFHYSPVAEHPESASRYIAPYRMTRETKYILNGSKKNVSKYIRT